MRIGTCIYLEKFLESPDYYKENYRYLEIQDFVMPTNLDNHMEDILSMYKNNLSDYKGTITVHAPYIDLKPTSFDPLVQSVFMKRCHQALNIAMKLNAQYMVVHSDYDRKPNYEDYKDFFLLQSTSLWKSLINDFQNTGITAVIENVHNPSGSLIKQIIEEVNNPYLGACLDIGHAHAFGKVQLSNWIDCYGPLLKYIHINDNDGELDQHLPLGEGSIDFSSFFQKLKEVGSESIIMCEVFGNKVTEEKNLMYLSKFF